MADNEGYGFLFPIKQEKRKENGPVMSGHVIFQGRKVKLSAWRKTSRNGTGYLNVKAEDGGVPTPQAEIPGTEAEEAR